MPTTLATNRNQLRQRLVRFFDARRLAERRSLADVVLPFFTQLGDAVIIGGMPRDIAMSGFRGFRSDIDLVLQPDDYGRYVEAVTSVGAVRNRFGGYGLRLGDWNVDVWALEDTWARQANHRRVDCFEDLLECTFFDSDAVLYAIKTRRVIARPDYLERLNKGVLGINLEANPNEKGSAVRAVRRAVMWSFRFSAPLANYVDDAIRKYGWRELVRLDADAFDRPVLGGLDECELRVRLANHVLLDGEWVTKRLVETPAQLTFENEFQLWRARAGAPFAASSVCADIAI